VNSSVCVASRLHPYHRQQLAVKVLSQQEPISQIANQEQVSRKFLYKQKDIAQKSLNNAFEKKERDQEVLYYLPVTQKWIFQLILGLIFICRSSYRGVVELLRDLFDYPISLGTIHNRVKESVPRARKINDSVDLSPINVASLDELFHSNRPILTGVDNDSSYCFLLQETQHRDEDTWGWYLLEATEQGLEPNYTIADAAKGIRAAHQAVWKDKVCQGDVWHILDQGETLCRSLDKKAQGATTQREKLEAQLEKTNLGSIKSPLSAKLTKAIKNEQNILKLASDVKILVYWLRIDILSLAGASWSERMELMDFVIEELEIRENKAHKGIKSLRVALSNQKDDLLAFANLIDQKLSQIASSFQIPLSYVREVCLLMKKPLSTNNYWQKWNQLHKKLSHKFWELKQAVEQALKSTPRASSLVENLNSRLRNYFHLRKHLGAEYLELLQFFLNHRTFMSSRKPERVSKSPTELMTGEKQPHWLEMLGFERFQRA
jgi:hypothetical protein